MQEDLITFDIEWLSLPKAEFRLLVMIAEVGSNIGCLNEICRYFKPQTQTPQSKTRRGIKENLKRLKNKGLISYKKSGRKYIATITNPIACDKKIELKREYLNIIKERKYAASVAWEQVLKCYLWISHELELNQIFTNYEIANQLNVSVDTVIEAKKPLKNEYEAVIIDKITDKVSEDKYITIGQTATLSAWWNA